MWVCILSDEYDVGKGKPPLHTRFGQPGGNIPGKTSAHRSNEIRAAELASKLRLDLLEAVDRVVTIAATDSERVEHVRSDILKLLKDSEDRGFGQPAIPVDNTSSDGSMTPSVIQIVPVAAGKPVASD